MKQSILLSLLVAATVAAAPAWAAAPTRAKGASAIVQAKSVGRDRLIRPWTWFGKRGPRVSLPPAGAVPPKDGASSKGSNV